MMSLADPTAYYALSLSPLDSLAAIELNANVAYTMIDRLLGGSGHGASLSRSLTEIEQLAGLVDGRAIAAEVVMTVACGREVYDRAEALGHVERVRRFGATFVNDTCWCFITEPVVPASAATPQVAVMLQRAAAVRRRSASRPRCR